jgi:hypothetical protein
MVSMRRINANVRPPGRRLRGVKRLGTLGRLGVMLASVVATAIVSGCIHSVIVEVPECPDTPDELFDTPLPPDWNEWYLNEYDPFCEALNDANNL